ncbi:P47K family cobalamin synthesis protein [Desulfosarcina ovata subsp. sediminis]|uniref:P47K family cobalamin synthesis protein n=1 Tax=Desulfosarcina ovata subsp. sediminis TaxID=885957 RepID=A0A5K7ZUA8_9BACT|nr:GTP-binding protein [Desulfosarcina ovata]BBO83788.1 P47K family cobalamin synthesis protein [Desulfosarcina ovata subsp. sediminis]
MHLHQPIPGDRLANSETGIQEILRYHLVRVNLVPGVRHVIGWRGLQNAAHNSDAWTARIDGYPGVFGLFFDQMEPHSSGIAGRFGLNYFPHPEESCVESLCVQAGMLTQQPDYYPRIRDFLSHPSMIELFNIAGMILSVNRAPDGMQLMLTSNTRQRVIAIDGIFVEHEGQRIQLVRPGDNDQNFPAFDTALDFFTVLATSMAFNLSQAPTSMVCQYRPGTVKAYDAGGQIKVWASDTIQEKRLILTYGNVGEADLPSVASDTAGWQDDRSLATLLADAPWLTAHQLRDCKSLDKSQLGIDERPQLIVVTGFLGAGKTSFLQHFIEHQTRNNRFVAVIQNEIGAVGLDGRVLDHDYAVVEIDEGCICCTLVGNVKKALGQIMSDFHPDYIVLETTGLANPFNLLDELAEVEEIVRFDSVTTLVDGLNLAPTLESSSIAHDQIRAADIILLNKKDQLTAGQIEESKTRIARINPDALVFTTSHGDINPALIYNADPLPVAAGAKSKPVVGKHATHRHEQIDTHTITFSHPLAMKHLTAALDQVPKTIFRIKGIVNLVGEATPRLVQYVAGRYALSEFNSANTDDRYLVFIGQRIDPLALERLFDLPV